MRTEPKYKIEAATSKDENRPRLNHVYFSGRHLIATDGKIMAVVPCQKDETDTVGLVSLDALKQARKLSGKRGEIAITLNGDQKLISGVSIPRPDLAELGFPKFGGIITGCKRDATGFSVGIDTALLACLADAIGSDKVCLTFQMSEPEKKPILVTPVECGDAYGIIMPCGKR